MRNTRIRKSPLSVEESSVVHRRAIFARITAYEQGNFTRWAEFSANLARPEEQR